MRSSHLVLAAAVVAVLVSAAIAAADGPADQVQTYTILRNDSPIGTQSVRFQNVGERLIIQYRIRIRVDVLFVNAYSYDMDAREDWRGDRLERMTVETDKNGEELTTEASISGGALAVRGSEGSMRAPLGAIPAGPFVNALDRHPSHVIDAETGEVIPVEFSGPRRVTLRIGERSWQALRYRMTGERESTLWYREDGVLIRQRLVAEDDSVIEFRMR